MADRLLGISKAREMEVAGFLRDLVRIPSVNGHDPELDVAERIVEEANRLRLSARLVAAAPGRPNVLVEWGRGQSGFALLGHTDTVAAGDPADWTHPPFAAEIKDGRLYGRGVADNKAGIACALYTLAVLRDGDLLDPEQVRVVLAGVVDEESGASSPSGVRYLLDQGLLNVQGAIYTYAGDDKICIGHRGLLRLVLQAIGQAVHSGSGQWSRHEKGVNAVTGLATILVQLEAMELPTPPHPAFAGLRCTITPGTLFHGGEFESMVPAHAEATVDIRLMPGQSAQEILAAVEQIIAAEITRRPGLSVTLQIKNELPAAAIPADHRLAQCAQHYTQAITGHTWPLVGAGPANEGYLLINAGIPTLCGFGPEGGRAHAPDEWVSLDSLPQTVAMYAGVVRDYLAER